MYGGARLDKSITTPFKGVEKMLELGQVKLVFCKTHTSFIFSINIPPTTDPTPFYVLNKARSELDAPVYSIVLKFAIIMPNCELSNFKCRMCAEGECKTKDVEKGCVKEVDIMRECKTQQEIYYETVQTGNPICPAVIDLSFLDSTQLPFLQTLLSKCDESAIPAMQYLQASVKAGAKLAMISMEFARGEGAKVIPGDKVSDAILVKAAPKILAAMLKLAVMGYVNYDFHSANVMIAVENNNVVDATMIDFGRVAKLNSLNPAVMEYIMKRANFPIDQLLKKMGTANFYTNPFNVMMALAAIADMDLGYNITLFNSHQIQCRDIILIAFNGLGSLGQDPPVLYPNRNEGNAYVPNPVIAKTIIEFKNLWQKKVKVPAPWGIGGRTHRRKHKTRLVTKSSKGRVGK
jgi:hypothetical protein